MPEIAIAAIIKLKLLKIDAQISWITSVFISSPELRTQLWVLSRLRQMNQSMRGAFLGTFHGVWGINGKLSRETVVDPRTMMLRSRTQEPEWDLRDFVFFLILPLNFTVSLIYLERHFNKICFF